MQLINSDGQIVDARQTPQAGGSANRNSNTIIDNGKYIATVAICAAISGGCAVAAWSAINRQEEISYRYHDDTKTLQDEYQKVRNHTIELEARQKALADELQEMKRHER